ANDFNCAHLTVRRAPDSEPYHATVEFDAKCRERRIDQTGVEQNIIAKIEPIQLKCQRGWPDCLRSGTANRTCGICTQHEGVRVVAFRHPKFKLISRQDFAIPRRDPATWRILLA